MVEKKQQAVERVGDLLDVIVRELVDEPESVQVTRVLIYSSEMARERGAEPEGIVYRVAVASKDIGKIVGKQGRTARAIRTLLVSMGRKSDINYQLDIVDMQEEDHA